jgi:molybdopterin synthase sulfur carrier subunit
MYSHSRRVGLHRRTSDSVGQASPAPHAGTAPGVAALGGSDPATDSINSVGARDAGMYTVTWRLFADLAEVADGREHTVSVGADATVGDAIDALLAEAAGLEDRVLDDDTVANDVNLMRNGSPTAPSASVDDGDELAMFPPVTGGQ